MSEVETRTERCSPAPDETLAGTRGAIMVIGMMMALFLAGLLYYCIGIGNAILYRERVQDAADAAAFAAAVVDARGMNIIVLTNLVMAGAIAVLVGRLASAVLAFNAIDLARRSAVDTGGASLVAIGPLTTVMSATIAEYRRVESGVMVAMEHCYEAAEAVRTGMPTVANGKAVSVVMGGYTPPAQGGFVYAGSLHLPVEVEPVDPVRGSSLCLHAQSASVDHVLEPFRPPHIPVSPPLPTIIREYLFYGAVLEETARYLATTSAADFLCGRSNNAFVSRRNQPESIALQNCIMTGSSADCNRARLESEQEQYDPSTGECVTGRPAGAVRGACVARINRARRDCEPRPGRRIVRYTYQQEEVTLSGGLPVGPASGTRVVESPVPPCGLNGVIDTSYYTSGPFVCHTPRSSGRVRVVREILGCIAESPQAAPVMVPPPTWRPHRVLPSTMGADHFQIHGFVAGNRDASRLERGVRVANRGHADLSAPSDGLDAVYNMSGLALAQSEFFFAGREGAELWPWAMRWQARLTRVHLPAGLTSAEVAAACGSFGGLSGADCGRFGMMDMNLLRDALAH